MGKLGIMILKKEPDASIIQQGTTFKIGLN